MRPWAAWLVCTAGSTDRGRGESLPSHMGSCSLVPLGSAPGWHPLWSGGQRGEGGGRTEGGGGEGGGGDDAHVFITLLERLFLQHNTPKAATFPKKNELPWVGFKPTTLRNLDRTLYQL